MKSINFHWGGKGISLALIFMTLILYFPLLVWGLDVPTITTWTNVSGIINSDTTWTLANSPYIVTGNVLVNENVTLTIEPGVTVKFDSGKSLVVNGELIGRGMRDEKIIFTSNQATPAPGDWGQIYFADTCLDATFDSSGNYISGTILEHCIIEYGGNSSTGMLCIGNSRPFINLCLVSYSSLHGIYAEGSAKLTNNIIENNTGYGIASYGIATDISNNIITNNKSVGVGISSSQIPFSNNIVIGNSEGGIHIWNGPITITKNVIHNNKKSYNSDGGGIQVEGLTDITISNNIISNNIAFKGLGGGISISGRTGFIVGNSFVSNISPNASAVLLNVSNAVQNVNHNLFFNNISNDAQGATILITGNPSWNYNNYIANGSKYEIYNDNYTPGSITNCKSNWWGTTNPTSAVIGVF